MKALIFLYSGGHMLMTTTGIFLLNYKSFRLNLYAHLKSLCP